MIDELIKEFEYLMGYLPIISLNMFLTIFHLALALDI